MTPEQKSLTIRGIIYILNEHLKQKNERLCQQNLYDEQIPLHGDEMFLKLAFMSDQEIVTIANKCGL